MEYNTSNTENCLRTKYGNISLVDFDKYKKKLIGRVFAILPMREENSPTVDDYIDSLNYELMSVKDIFDHFEDIFVVISLLHRIKTEANHKIYRREILHCCNIIANLNKAVVTHE